jgi:hypothetical protein
MKTKPLTAAGQIQYISISGRDKPSGILSTEKLSVRPSADNSAPEAKSTKQIK